MHVLIFNAGEHHYTEVAFVEAGADLAGSSWLIQLCILKAVIKSLTILYSSLNMHKCLFLHTMQNNPEVKCAHSVLASFVDRKNAWSSCNVVIGPGMSWTSN